MKFPVQFAHASRAQGIACVLYSICVWSGWMIVSSYSVRGSLNSYDIAAIRFGVSGLIYLPILLRKGFSVGPLGWKGGVLLSLLMGAPYSIIAIYGMKYAPASHAAGIINTTMLTVTTIGSIFLLREATTRLRLLGLFLSVLGIACMLFAGHAPPGSDMFLGHLCFIIGGVMWAGYVIGIKAWHVPPLHAAAAVCSFSLLIYIPIYLLFLPVQIGMHNLDEVLFQCAYQGVINGVFSILCFSRGVHILGAGTASAFLPLVPPLATLLAVPFLHEVPSWMAVAGISLAAVGVLLSTGIVGSRARRDIHCTAPPDGAAAGN